MRRVRVTALLTSLALLGLAPAARANGTVSVDAGATQLTYQAQPGDADRFIMDGVGSAVTFHWNLPALLEPDGVPITAGAHCAQLASTVVCPRAPAATLDLGDGNDLAAIIGDSLEAPETTVNGGDGNDSLFGQGSGSPPLTLRGGPDDDLLADGAATDSLDGGSGNDTLRYIAGGADDLHGGSGTDTVQFNPASAVAVSLDDVANDGHAGTANIHSDIEVVEGTPLGDQLTGGPGANTLNAGDGNDTITARDGAVDTIDCGAGSDTAVVDSVDVVSNCETVQAPTSPTPPGDGGGVLPKVAAQIQASWKVNKAHAKLRRLNVSKVPAGGKVEVLCAGKGCAFSRKTATVKRGAAALTRLFKGRKLKPGAVIEVRVTAPGMTGQVVRFTVRKGKKTPARSTLCLARGAAKPAACA
jgi:Ca2+-binding RTX toxin-like protein